MNLEFLLKDRMENINFNNKYKVHPVYGKHVERFIVQNHYAQRVPSISYAFGLIKRSNNKMVGVITFGMPPSPILTKKIPFKYFELNRIALIEHDKNIVTWWLSKCIKLLPKPLLLISFADQNKGHVGYVYQASNWMYTGLSTATPEFIVNGRIRHIRHVKTNTPGIIKIKKLPKHRYFLPIGSQTAKKKMRQWIQENYEILPYPKGDSKKYNMTDEKEEKNKLLLKKGLL